MKNMKKTARRFLSLLLTAAMVLSAVPATTLTLRAEGTFPDADDLPDNDELFAGYAMRTLYGGGDVSLYGSYGETALSGLDLKIYEALKEKISAVADGTEASTSFLLTWEELGIAQTTWTQDELTETIIVDNDISDAAIQEITEKIGYDSKRIPVIMDCLLADCPYELYWYDKTVDVAYPTQPEVGASNKYGVYSIYFFEKGITLSFPVASAYARTDAYTTDITKTSAASAAAANAQAVITANADKSDYEKLKAYRDYICAEVSYNNDAADDSYIGGYGDPWQLIHVFDGNEDTNVVCEGYAKAFQYLCDLSAFEGDVTCYTVTGTMSGGTGEGNHMWNIVTLDGQNYLVDVTNSDEKTVGADGGLFLAGTSGSVEDGYTFAIGSQWVKFQYDADTTALYSAEILTLAEADYTEPEPEPEYVASVTIGDETRNYIDFNEAWSAAQAAASATVTLLADVNLSNTYLTVASGQDITLDSAEKANGEEYSLTTTGTGTVFITVEGTFTLAGGNISYNYTDYYYSYGIVVYGGSFTMTGGSVSVNQILSYAVFVNGGSVDIRDGAIHGQTYSSYGMYVSNADSISISGGTISGYYGLSVSEYVGIGTVTITGGSFSAVFYGNSSNSNTSVKSLLANGYAYYNDGTLITDGLDSYMLSNVEVKPCTHSFDDSGKCVACNTQAVVSVKIGEQTTYYSAIEDAWSAAKRHTATITLLDDVTVSESLTVEDGDDITLTSENKADETAYTLNGSVAGTLYKYLAMVNVNGGSLTLQSGNVVNKSESGNTGYSSERYYAVTVNGGAFTMEGGTISAGNIGVILDGGKFTLVNGAVKNVSSGVYVYSGEFIMQGGELSGSISGVSTSSQSTGGAIRISAGYISGRNWALIRNNNYNSDNVEVVLTGGTYYVSDWWSVYNDEGTLADFLGQGYAYQYEDGTYASASNTEGKYFKQTVTVVKAPIQSVNISVDNENPIYGDSLTFKADVTLAEEYKDYPVTYEWADSDGAISGAAQATQTVSEADAATYQRTVTVTCGGYSLTSGVFEITVEPKDLSEAQIEVLETCTYSGSEQEPAIQVMLDGKLLGTDDYDAVYSSNINAGDEAKVTITGKNNYKGEASQTFTISKLQPTITFWDNSVSSITWQYIPGYVLSDERIKSYLTVTGVSLEDVVVTWTDSEGRILDAAPDNTGTYTITASVAEMDNTLEAAASIKVYIQPKPVTPTSSPAISIILSSDTYEYDGTEKEPEVTVMFGETLIDPSEYIVAYSNNVEIGTATVTIIDAEGGNYEVSGSTSFQINRSDLSTADVKLILPAEGYTYDGNEKTPEIEVVKDGVTVDPDEYIVSYSNTSGGEGDHTSAGTVTVTVTAVDGGHYDGRNNTATFTIERADISAAEITLADSLMYSGKEQTQNIIVTQNGMELKEGTDYTVFDNTGTDAGDYTLTISGTGNYTGEAEADFTISRAKVMVYSWSATDRTYEQGNLNVEAKITFNGYGVLNAIEHNVTAVMDDDSAGENKNVTLTVTVTDPNYELCTPDGDPIDFETKTTTVNIAKAEAEVEDELAVTHVYNSAVTREIDLGALLPADRGETSYTVTSSGDAAIGSMNGDTLTYTTAEDQAAVSGEIAVTAVMQNYQDVMITLKVSLTDPLTVSGQPASVTYGDSAFTLTASGGLGDSAVTWESSDDVVASVDENGKVTITGAGTVTLTATKKNGANDGDAAAAVTFTVAQKVVTVSGITAEDKTYDGTADAALKFEGVTFDGIVEGDSLTVTAAGTFADQNAGGNKTVSITGLALGGADAGNYVLAESGQQSEAEAAITPKDVTVEMMSVGGAYGDVSEAEAKLVGVVEGDTVDVTLTYTGTANDGTTVYDGTDVPTEAGAYTVTASITDGNYNLTGAVTADFAVARADAGLSVSPEQADKTYGDTAFALTAAHAGDDAVTYTSDKADVVSVDENGVVTLHNAGTAVITVTLAQTANYEGGEISVAVTVKQKDDTLTVEELEYIVTYGDADFAVSCETESGSKVGFTSSNPDVVTVDENGMVRIVGAGTAVITLSTEESRNYNVISETVTVTVKPRDITVTADNLTMTYGEDDPKLTYTVSGLVVDDALDGIILTRAEGKDAGDYEITVSQESGANPNYSIAFVNGTLTITQRTAQLSWSNTSMTYNGEAQKPAASVSNLLSGDTCIVTVTNAQKNVGHYTAAADALSNSNYKLPEDVTAEFAITPKDITVEMTSVGGAYGDVSEAEAKLVGVVEGDTVDVTLTYTGTANDGTTVYDGTDVPTEAGAYTVTASITDGNYNLTGTVTADFAVARADAELSVSPEQADKTYGDTAFALTAAHAGDGAVTYTSDKAEVASVDENGVVTLHNAGTAVITVTLAQTANYEGGEISVAVTVKQKDDTLTVEELEYIVTYGDADFAVSCETESGSKAVFTSSNPDVVTVDENGMVHIVGAGTAVITLSTEESRNYNVISETVTVTVKPRDITVTADNLTMTYGEDDPKLTYTVSGLVGDDALDGIILTRAEGKDAGDYEITVSQESGANPNYSIAFVNGTLTIQPKDITGAAVELGAELTENGELQTQEIGSVTVRNSNGETLEVTYTVTGNTGLEQGTYTMTITGTGNFTGTITEDFVIAPAADSGEEPNPDHDDHNNGSDPSDEDNNSNNNNNNSSGTLNTDPNASANTSDDSRFWLRMLLLLLSGSGLAEMIFQIRRKKNKAE